MNCGSSRCPGGNTEGSFFRFGAGVARASFSEIWFFLPLTCLPPVTWSIDRPPTVSLFHCDLLELEIVEVKQITRVMLHQYIVEITIQVGSLSRKHPI
jgi:hypothetical protein